MARTKPPPADLPLLIEPQLATLVQRVPPGDWCFELKFDGYRMLVRVDGVDVRLVTRRGNDWTDRFPALVRELRRRKLPKGWYDGEIVMLDERGQPDFNLLQNAIDSGSNDEIVIYLFDAPFLGGADLRQQPVEVRRARLREVLAESRLVRFSEDLPGGAPALLASACKLGLEGIIGKRRGSRYVSVRSPDWIKLKCARRQEFVIGGFTWRDGSRIGIGALLVGSFDERQVLHYAGKVGTGFTGETLTLLRKRLDTIAQPKRPFFEPTGHDRHATWVRPEMVCEVEYREWPAGGSLRHASFKGLREDKPAALVRRESSLEAQTPLVTRAAAPRSRAAPATNRGMKVTHADRVVDPSTGLTKGDVVAYYARVAPWALPHLKGRHTYLVRMPEGIEGPRIFQQHPENSGLRGTAPDLWPGHAPAFAFQSARDLAQAAQLGMIELHTWNSTAKDILHPDRLVFDLDPGDDTPWGQVRQAAELTRATLQALHLESWLKTTGGKGLHVVVPVKPEYGYDDAKELSRRIVMHMAKVVPQLFVAKSGPRNRVGRVFIDFLRNGQSQSTAAAFSARGRPGLGVSVPVAWSELKSLASGAHWTIVNVFDRLDRLGTDPWAGYWKCRQSLRPAAERFGL